MKKILVLLLTLYPFLCFSQVVPPPDNLRLFLEIDKSAVNPNDISAENLFQGTSSIDQGALPKIVRMEIELNTLDDLDLIHVFLGTSLDTGDLLSQTFVLDDDSDLPTHLKYIREENILYLKLGTFSGFEACYGKVILEDLDGNQSIPTFITSGQ